MISPSFDLQLQAIAKDFKAEVKDKLHVIVEGHRKSPLERSIHFNQCELFLVEKFEKALREVAALQREQDAQIVENLSTKSGWFCGCKNMIAAAIRASKEPTKSSVLGDICSKCRTQLEYSDGLERDYPDCPACRLVPQSGTCTTCGGLLDCAAGQFVCTCKLA